MTRSRDKRIGDAAIRAFPARALTPFAPECYLRLVRLNVPALPRDRRALSIAAALLVLVGTLFASVGACFAMPDAHVCCAGRMSGEEAAVPCELASPASCCEPGHAPAPPSRLASAAVHFDAPLALLPSQPSALAPRLRLPRGAAPLPRTALLLRAAVLRL
ncbi:MAG TPA: hypothetical protein VFT98_10885 [Myxococcota bacterium]|nr:hypothetical protein [Myxococcota bacterium]